MKSILKTLSLVLTLAVLSACGAAGDTDFNEVTNQEAKFIDASRGGGEPQDSYVVEEDNVGVLDCPVGETGICLNDPEAYEICFCTADAYSIACCRVLDWCRIEDE